LVVQISTGTLCTLAIEPLGYPYGSFVTVAFEQGTPIFLISALAEHTKNLEQDPRASLLVAESGSAGSARQRPGHDAGSLHAHRRTRGRPRGLPCRAPEL
jgi:putative heme iron utilization protein